MDHKQKSIRDYFLASLPNVNITLLEDARQLKFTVYVASNRLTHQIIFNRIEFRCNSIRDIFNWLHKSELIRAIQQTATPIEMIFKGQSIAEVDSNAGGVLIADHEGHT